MHFTNIMRLTNNMCFNMQGALPTPWVSVNLACLSACHPTIPEQLMLASQTICTHSVISIFAHNVMPHNCSFLCIHSLTCLLTLKLSYECTYSIRSTNHTNFRVTKGNWEIIMQNYFLFCNCQPAVWVKGSYCVTHRSNNGIPLVKNSYVE